MNRKVKLETDARRNRSGLDGEPLLTEASMWRDTRRLLNVSSTMLSGSCCATVASALACFTTSIYTFSHS